MENRILRIKEVIQMTGLSRTTIYGYVKNGEFPKQVQLTKRSVGWKLSEIKNWIDNRDLAS